MRVRECAVNPIAWRCQIHPEAVLLSWSGGKDSAMALVRLRQSPDVEVVGLLTTVTTRYERISIHGVRRTLLQRQSEALQLPVHEIEIEPQCSNEAYQASWAESLRALPGGMTGARCIAFGDIFLEDVRRYRETMAEALGLRPVFPLWGESTISLAEEVLRRRFAARIVCVDTRALPASFVGRVYDADFIDALPASADPCGERGEFHTFVSAGPGFQAAVAYRLGEKVLRDDRFAYCDLVPDGDAAQRMDEADRQIVSGERPPEMRQSSGHGIVSTS